MSSDISDITNAHLSELSGGEMENNDDVNAEDITDNNSTSSEIIPKVCGNYYYYYGDI